MPANNGLELDEELVARLDEVAGRAGVRVVFAPGADPRLAPESGGVDGAIARLLAIVAGAVEQGRWQRLKACPRETCNWAFYDQSKNRSGRWCRMEVCGQRREGARVPRAQAEAQSTSGGIIASTSPLTRPKISSARSRCSRSWVAITEVRSSAPLRCTAG